MNIYTKLTLLCLSLVLFTAGVLSFFADQQVQKKLKEEIVSSITQKSNDISNSIGRFMFSRLNDVRLAAQNSYFQNDAFNTEDLNEELKKLENLNDLYYSFSFFNPDRVRLGDSKGLSIGVKHSKSLYWNQLAQTTESVVDISKSESVDEITMHFASYVKKEGETIGVLVSRILVDELFQIVGDYSLGTDIDRKLNISLIDNNGLILYSNTDKSSILTKKYDKPELINRATNEGVNVIETDEEIYFISKNTDYLTFKDNKWVLALSISKDLAYTPVVEVRDGIFWAVVPVVIIAIIIAIIAANLFVRPIIKLSKAAEEIGKGSLKQDIPTNRSDEIGKLARQLSISGELLITNLEEQKSTNDQLQGQKEKIESQKNQLEEFSEQIRDSISYAKRILHATLPPLDTLQRIFPGSFVMFKPKDVIGGDFYWFERVRKGNKEFMIIACADCTGHGVPGGIMSIMGSNQLTNIIYYQNYLDPRKIIARLDKVIKFELQRDKAETKRDGMEIAVCAIDLDTLQMEFSGVGIPLRLKRVNAEELETIKTPRLMAGGIEGDEQEAQAQLEKHKIQLQEGDRIFLATDGFQDQFGGESDRKYMTRNFNQLLIQSSKESAEDQKSKIENEFEAWTKNTQQTDDITIIGIEVS